MKVKTESVFWGLYQYLLWLVLLRLLWIYYKNYNQMFSVWTHFYIA